ncbi:hypothetical protein QTP70_007134 [Hemibagrus guttatus]|uniref:Uncharacterized protein n=1 Tax=Hemibagrus guttatus TaxID=175788 RepID=A0AAE0RIR4_9TELE|nr:hypothetical protein QTP70_007134 [Hemibagrus guttatus]KAK3574252.1 hypothetical protein QTP86_004401 [Hemibagrus guttatus]
MDTYIQDSLAAGIIWTSSSPAGAGFFFVEKKDKSLRPCIDYQDLNKITIKNCYPLSLMSSTFELLQGASISAMLITLSGSVKSMSERQHFNTPTGHYEYFVMPFGLTNTPAVF